MNTVVAIMRKDFVRMAGPLTIWGVAGLHLIWPQKGASGLFGETQILSLFVVLMFTVVMIAWVIQEDSPLKAEAFWRSRPIAPAMMLGSKLTFLAVCFVAIPIVGILIGEAIAPGFFRRIDRLPSLMGFLLCSVIACAALAACTRNLGEYLLFGIGAGVLTVNLGSFLEAFSPLAPPEAYRLSSSQLFVAMSLCGAGGLAALLVQYHLRRALFSFGVIAVTLVSVALVDAFWSVRIY